MKFVLSLLLLEALCKSLISNLSNKLSSDIRQKSNISNDNLRTIRITSRYGWASSSLFLSCSFYLQILKVLLHSSVSLRFTACPIHLSRWQKGFTPSHHKLKCELNCVASKSKHAGGDVKSFANLANYTDGIQPFGSWQLLCLMCSCSWARFEFILYILSPASERSSETFGKWRTNWTLTN